MVSVWTLSPDGVTIEADGVLKFSNGLTFELADIPGNGWNAKRLAKLATAVQAVLDDVQPVANIPAGDLDEGATAAELFARYGNRRFLDGKGNIVSRSTKIGFEFRPPDEEAVLPKQLIVTLTRVV